MAKILIKSAKLTPFGGIFSIMEQFDSLCAAFVIILISIYYMSSDSFKEIFVITVYYSPLPILPTSFSDNELHICHSFKVFTHLSVRNTDIRSHFSNCDSRIRGNHFVNHTLCF